MSDIPYVPPCPFCGEIPELSHNSKPGYVDFIWCHTCGYDMRLDRYCRRVKIVPIIPAANIIPLTEFCHV